MAATDREEAKAIAETASDLFKSRFGYAPDNKDREKKAEWVLWRYGGQGFVDAVATIEELKRVVEAARVRRIIEG